MNSEALSAERTPVAVISYRGADDDMQTETFAETDHTRAWWGTPVGIVLRYGNTEFLLPWHKVERIMMSPKNCLTDKLGRWWGQ